MSSSSGSITLTSPRSSGTTHSVVLVHQPAGPPPAYLRSNNHSRSSLRRQICVVVRNLEAVVSELNSVMDELQGVLEQIDRVTGCLDSSLSGRLLYLRQSTDDETLWTARRKRSVSSGCSVSTHPSKSSSSSSSTTTTSSSSSSTDLSSLWKLPRKPRSRSSSSGKRRSRKINDSSSNTCQETRAPAVSLRGNGSERHGKHLHKHESLELRIDEVKDKVKCPKEPSRVRLREKTRKHKRAFLHGICCARTQSVYSAESGDARPSCLSDDGTWVLRKGNGVQSPMYPGPIFPAVMGDNHPFQPITKPRSSSEGKVSSCSNQDNGRSQNITADLKSPNGRPQSANRAPVRTSGISSSSDDTTLHTISSCGFMSRYDSQLSNLMKIENDEHILLTTYLSSPVTSARMNRRSDLFVGDIDRSDVIGGDLASCGRKPKNGIYQYESEETELSQGDANPSEDIDGGGSDVYSPVSDPSFTISIGPTLSEIEPDMVETDSEIEFSLMPTIPPESGKPTKRERHTSSTSSPCEGNRGLRAGSPDSLAEREDFKQRYMIYSYDSEAENSRHSKRKLSQSRDKELATEGLKLLLYGDASTSTEDISEQKQKIMAELDNLKLSFNSDSSSPESENGKLLRRSLTQFDDFRPDWQPMTLSELHSLSSPGSNGESPLSNGFETDPEVKAFLQELDKKIKENDPNSESVDNVSVFTSSKESLTVSDNIFSSKLAGAVLDENSNIKMNTIFRSSMDSVLTEGSSHRGYSSDPGDSDHLMESFEWEHSFMFSMYQETGSKIPALSPDEEDADKTVNSSFPKNFDLDEAALTYSLSYPLEKAKSASLSSESFVWSEGSMASDRRLDSTGKSVDELLSELDISADLLFKPPLKRPETLVPSLDQKYGDSQSRSEGTSSDYKVGYNRDINTWTAFAMVHIGGSDSNLSKCSAVSDGASHASGKSSNLGQVYSPQDTGTTTTTTTTEIQARDYQTLEK